MTGLRKKSCFLQIHYHSEQHVWVESTNKFQQFRWFFLSVDEKWKIQVGALDPPPCKPS